MIKDDKLSDVIGTLHKLTSAIFSDAIQRKLILDNLTEAVFTVDLDLRITSFNKAAQALTGIPEEEALGKVCTTLFRSPMPMEGFCIISRVLEEKRPLTKQTRHLLVGDRLLPVMVSASPLTDNNGNVVGGVQSFQEIREIFLRQLVLDCLFDGVFTVDLRMNVTFFNKAAEQLTGFRKEDVLGRSFVEVLQPLVRGGDEGETPLARAIETGDPVVEDGMWIHRADGNPVPVSVRAVPLRNARGEIIGGAQSFKDVTDQLQSRFILDSVADGVFTVNEDFVITSFNRAAEKITGYSAKEALGKRCSEIFQTKVCDTNCPMARALTSKSRVFSRNIVMRRKDGKGVPVSVSVTALVDYQGNVLGGVETIRDLTEVTELRRKLSREGAQHGILSRSPRMQRILSVLPEFAKSDSNILVLGESGTGKELIAQSIHRLSHRQRFPFVAVNSGALPDTLLESELFGYKAGAFTDARRDKKGRFAAAERGTLFLDEIGDISPAMQVKLLRVLQTKTYEPLGSNVPVKTDVRIIAATNRNLEEMVRKGTFREDLYYRLNVVKIDLPPLRERMEDLPLLVEHFIQKFNEQRDRDVKGISEEALSVLMRHEYPGNIRELENIIEYAFILCHDGLILPQHLPEWLVGENVPTEGASGPLTLKEIEKRAIIEALNRNNFRKMKTCRELGISKDTLRRKLNSYGIKTGDKH